MKKTMLITGVIAMFAIGFISCTKENAGDDQNNTTIPPTSQNASKSVQDNAVAESIFSGVFNQVDKASRDAKSGFKTDSSSCPVVTINSISSYPMTVTIDFGQNCTCYDGRVRSGQIIAVLSGPYLDSGSVATVTFSQYKEIVNGKEYSVQATETHTNMGHNAAGHQVFGYNVQDAVITSVDGVIHWNSTRLHEWIEGDTTLFNIWDDVYLVTGDADGTNTTGESFSINILTPLRVQISCSYIVSGTLEVITQANPAITLDYGDGTCDNIATAYVYGYTVVIYM
jgi:hypothetical protein